MEIAVDTSQLQSAADKLKQQATEMEAAVNACNSAVGPLRDMKSPRVQRDVTSWDEIRQMFQKNMENLVAAAEEVLKAAQANEAANA